MNGPQPSTRSNFNSQYPVDQNPGMPPSGTYPPQGSQAPPPHPISQQQTHGYGTYVDSAQPYNASSMPPPPPEMLQQQGTMYSSNNNRPSMSSNHSTAPNEALPQPSPPQRRGVMDFLSKFLPAPKAEGEGSLFNSQSWLTRLPCFATKYLLLTITFILLLIACIVILIYLVLSRDQGCGSQCKSLGDPGLYLSAFGDSKIWYGASNKTCQNWQPSDVMFAAINYHQFGLYKELKWSPVCNKCVRVAGPRGTVQAKITDICDNCTYGSIMLSEPAFRLIADNGVENVPVTWGPC
ncbi:hypothetical protein H4219_001578 [Mycoemilia scoparia]|uniref:Uncharacterized protein n=1 Tax=Mycoemilia scoparia TaxID=417184 RepID=A0A9W8DQ70_9FUNG|nr:hypothetical protein H4219_001578 [Mycoemilia scoparia]